MDFEGRKEGSIIALLTNGQGFVRRSKIYGGNISEPSTLREVVSELEADSKKETGLFDAKPVAVMDAGIATEENLAFLRSVNFDYICVSRDGLQDYTLAQPGSKTVFDISTSLNNHNRNHPIEINMATPEAKENGDLYLYVKSAMKQQKEESMNNKLTKRFVSELEYIKSSLSKRRGIKEEGAVNQRIGRLKQKYPSIGKHYHIYYSRLLFA